jgi:hypothetical protein
MPIFFENLSPAARFLGRQDMTRQDAINFIIHGIVKGGEHTATWSVLQADVTYWPASDSLRCTTHPPIWRMVGWSRQHGCSVNTSARRESGKCMTDQQVLEPSSRVTSHDQAGYTTRGLNARLLLSCANRLSGQAHGRLPFQESAT